MSQTALDPRGPSFVVTHEDECYKLQRQESLDRWNIYHGVAESTLLGVLHAHSLRKLCFYDVDDCFYVVEPYKLSWCTPQTPSTPNSVEISVAAAAKIAAVIDPDATYLVASDEHLFLDAFRQGLNLLIRASLDDTWGFNDDDKQRGPKIRLAASAEAEKAYRVLGDLGFNSEQADLAVRLARSKLHVRHLVEMVSTVPS